MKVLKFGGTSIGSVENIKKAKELVVKPGKKIVVLSAMNSTTNFLLDIVEAIKKDQKDRAYYMVKKLHESYIETTKGLLKKEYLSKGLEYVHNVFSYLSKQTLAKYSIDLERRIVAAGELLSTNLFTYYLQEKGHKAVLIDALEFMRVDRQLEPDYFYITQTLNHILAPLKSIDVVVTQGFICRDFYGNITNLQRGGSDYTATIIANCMDAEEVQIWTDIDGFHNSDPRYVSNTYPIDELSFDEAAELAYFGAKILHPQTVFPAQEKNIPVRIKDTLGPKSKGTFISSNQEKKGVKAIAAKDGITIVKIRSARMLLAHGFLRRVFEIFEVHKTAIDVITTSEISLSLTIDSDHALGKIVAQLQEFSQVEIDQGMSIVCLAGNDIIHSKSISKAFFILNDMDIRMISFGGSNNNISLVVKTKDKERCLNKLNEYVFPKPIKAKPKKV